jgi:hypothetical protein
MWIVFEIVKQVLYTLANKVFNVFLKVFVCECLLKKTLSIFFSRFKINLTLKNFTFYLIVVISIKGELSHNIYVVKRYNKIY